MAHGRAKGKSLPSFSPVLTNTFSKAVLNFVASRCNVVFHSTFRTFEKCRETLALKFRLLSDPKERNNPNLLYYLGYSTVLVAPKHVTW